MMFNKREMKLIDYKNAQKNLLNGISVYMVRMDGSLLELTEATDWQSVFFHNLKGGCYAIYRRKFNGIGAFNKTIHIGKTAFTVKRTKEGGGASWKFASCRDKQ